MSNHFVVNDVVVQPIRIEGALTREVLENILIKAHEYKSSDITIQAGIPIKIEVGPKKFNLTFNALNKTQVEGIAELVYGPTAIAETNRGYAIDCSYSITRNRNTENMKKWRFRVNITRGSGYEVEDALQLTLRALPSEPIHYSKLDIPKDIIENYRAKDGLVIITGPTGSGKSTLMSSLNRMLLEDPNRYEKIVEFSKPIEYVYDEIDHTVSWIHQIEMGKHLIPRGDSYTEPELWNSAVYNSLRRKADIIIVGESRDKATIAGTIEGSNTGSLYVTTMHTVGVAETINRMLMAFQFEERSSIAATLVPVLRMIVTQTLEKDVNGNRIALREYMVFEEWHRRELLKYDFEQWQPMIKGWLDDGRTKGMSRSRNARMLFEQGRISEDVFNSVNYGSVH